MKLHKILRSLSAIPLVVGMLGTAHGQIAIQGATLGLNGIVFSVESLASGKVVLGGTFNAFNGNSSSGLGLIRLTSSATKDPVWDIGFVSNVRDTLVLGNFLYVAGEFNSVRTISAGTISRPYLFRINLTGINDGKVDTSWTPTPDRPVYNLETDGTSLFVAGTFLSINGIARNGLAKISTTSTGIVDAAWNPNPDGTISSLKFANSQLYVGGGFGNIGGSTNNYIVRLSPANGVADTAWSPKLNGPISSIEADASYVYLGGKFSQVNGSLGRRGVIRFSIGAGTATFDSTWNPDPDGEVNVLLKSGTSLYMAGVFQNVGGLPRYLMAKVSDAAAGAVDPSFVPNPNGAVIDMKVSGGQILCGGRFSTTVGAASAAFAKLDATSGSASAGFAGVVSNPGNAYSMLPVAGNKMMVAGIFDTVNGVARKGLARFNSDGSLDTSFQADLSGYNPVVNDMKVDGSFLYIVGDFFKVAGQSLTHAARINTGTGAVDPAWNPHPYTPLKALETDGTYVYLGSGGLKNIGIGSGSTVQVFNLARVTKTAPPTIDTAWTPVITGNNGDPAIGDVEDIVLNGSNLIIAGSFAFLVNPSNFNQFQQHVNLASLSTSAPWPPTAGFTDVYDNTIRRILLFSGSLYVGGDFFYINSTYQGCTAKVNPANGTWDQNFVGVDPVQSVDLVTGGANFSMFATNGNFLYVGGNFDYVYSGVGNIYNYSPYLVRANPTNGIYDASWSPYPDGPVNVMGFQANDLWMWGLYNFMGDQPMSDIVILRPTTASYQTWANTFFTPAQRTNADHISPMLDFDTDGLVNLDEFAFFMNPNSAAPQNMVAGTGTNGLPLIRQEIISGSKYLTVEFTQWKSSSGAGLTYTPQFSSDLTTGFAARGALLSTTSIDANRERVKYRDSIANLPRAFGWVKVTVP
jgi:hypothetical protein